ncbi:MAG: DUF456 domain-containing protein [Syntrophorhabdus sp.]
MQTLWIIITVLIMITGFLGTLLPVLPGLPLVYAGYIFYGLVTGWKDYGLGTMITWGLVVAGISFLDFYAGSIGAKKYGASKWAVWGSILGAFAGLFVAGFLGLILGPLVGALVGELIAGKSWREAFQSGWGTILGLVAGHLVKVALAIAMIGTFLWWVT